MSSLSPIILLMGPTASGKSDLAIALAARLPCDIISVDSALVYRGMDIGTAKPSVAVRAQVPHHLIDIRDPLDTYSAAQFCVDAQIAIHEITGRGRIPLLVGGTMMYFRALLQGLTDMPPADPAVRAQLEFEAREHGWAALHARLASVDPDAGVRIHPNDPQRIQRALEVYALTGSTTTELYARGSAKPLTSPVIRLVVAPQDRSILHARITRRFQAMLDDGFIEEVEDLRRRENITAGTPALRAVGYRQIWSYLEGKMNCGEMTKSAIIATRQLAKRQFTWLRSEKNVVWFNSLSQDLCNKVYEFCATALSVSSERGDAQLPLLGTVDARL